MSKQYAHMCRMDHTQIAHNDSETEQCPLCDALDDVHVLREALQATQDELDWFCKVRGGEGVLKTVMKTNRRVLASTEQPMEDT